LVVAFAYTVTEDYVSLLLLSDQYFEVGLIRLSRTLRETFLVFVTADSLQIKYPKYRQTQTNSVMTVKNSFIKTATLTADNTF